VFGPVEGALVISLALTASAALSFTIGRFLARRWVARKVGGHPRVQAVYRAVGEGGWKVVVAVRLSHAIPFGLQSFLFGLTPIPFRTYLLATWAAMLPGAFLYVYLGHLGAAALEAPDETWAGPSRWQWAARVLGLLAAAAALLYVTHLARRAIKEKTGLDPGDPDSVERRLLEGAEATVGEKAVKEWPWATLAVLLVSVLLLTAAAWSYAERDTIRQVVGHWFLDATPPR
jgi:membrane protein DedA with SNARE-associated domain